MHVRWNTGLEIFRGADVKRKIELNQIKRQTEILSTFMPDKILKINMQELKEAKSFVGVLLFVDVSGFTPLCEKYNKIGKGGIYRLTATLNAYIGALVEVIYFFGGDVLKFSGDAFLALWTAPPNVCLYEVIHEVIVCSLFIQETLGCFKTEVNILLKVKIAISCGNLTFSVIGNKTHRHYVIIGTAVNDVKEAEHDSVSGDVVISQSAWGHLSDEGYEARFTESGNVKIRGCVYSATQHELSEHYKKKCEIAQTLCEHHIEHRNRIHEMKKIDDATTDSKLIECFIAALPQRQAVENAPLIWIPSDLNPFIVRPVQSQIEEKQPIEYLTEMREVTIQFINIKPQTYNEKQLITMINKAFQIVCKAVSRVKGVVNKLSLFDKDAMMLVLFGLRGVKHELESQNALKSAFSIRKELEELPNVKSVSIGITNGLVYCGVVGHPFRREYTVIGGTVNKAARIMCAYEKKVTCDHITYKSCKLSSIYFQLQSALKLKGIDDAGYIFEYNENFSKTPDEHYVFGVMVGRHMELEFLNNLVDDPENVGWYGICFRGDPKVGKTKMLRSVLNKYGSKNKYIATVALNAASHRPYYCVSALYKQIYDILVEEHQSAMKHLPRDLWDLNEIFQSQSFTSEAEILLVSNKNTMLSNVLELCEIGKKPVIFIIDNINYIDSKSLEILDKALCGKRLRLICAGSFEDQISWNIMWNISLSNQIKLFNLEPMHSSYLLPLICKFLKVKGVAKKLLIVIDRICEGKPGWIETCLLKMINNEELEVKYWSHEDDFVFLDSNKNAEVVLVASFSRKYLECTEDITLAAISLDLFDSFSAHQQLIIKTGAVLGEIFSRTTLMILLKYPNEVMLASSIKTLFEEDVFDCASRYISSGGLQDKKYKCLCYTDEEDFDATMENFPKYAYCRLIHFKNKNIRVLAYELLPNNQKKELHLRITDLLENQVNSCPNCLRDNSAALIKLTKFNDLLAICTDPDHYKKLQDMEVGATIDTYKDIIRDVVKKIDTNQKQSKDVRIPRRKLWDPAVCFCTEILFKVYRDLIYHSHYGEHLGKKIFFMVQYSLVLFYLNEVDDAIPILLEASEICLGYTESYMLTGNFKFKMFCKIHTLLGFGYLRKGEIKAAKNHAMIALRRFNIPLISFNYRILQFLITRTNLIHTGSNLDISQRLVQLSNLELGFCIGLISAIYVAEGKWDLAKSAFKRTLFNLEVVNTNLTIFCDIYSNAIEFYTFCGDIHTCEKLERCLNNQLLKFYGKNATIELFILNRLFYITYNMKALTGEITQAIRMGYRNLSLSLNLHSFFRLLELIPTLTFILILVHRIDEAVHAGRILFNIGIKYHMQGFVFYYAFCIHLILETNFYLEPIEDIESFAEQHFTENHRHSKSGSLLIAGLYNYHLRQASSSLKYWKDLYTQSLISEYRYNSFTSIMILIRHTECVLLEFARCSESTHKHQHAKNAKTWLQKFEACANKFKIFMPRYLHYKAYYYRIKNKNGKSKQLLKKAGKAASPMGNILEGCWTELHLTYWFGRYKFERQNIGIIDWKSAKTYSVLQWCYVLTVLPYS